MTQHRLPDDSSTAKSAAPTVVNVDDRAVGDQAPKNVTRWPLDGGCAARAAHLSVVGSRASTALRGNGGAFFRSPAGGRASTTLGAARLSPAGAQLDGLSLSVSGVHG